MEKNTVKIMETAMETSDKDELMTEEKEKVKKRGIIYLSSIPKYMNVSLLREFMSEYGQIGRIYLQLADHEKQVKTKDGKKKRKTAIKHFTEGWVEFESKKVAKFVAKTLNNKQISTRKKSKFFDVLWCMKYLPKFKWVHLSERIAYERAVHKQRLRAEIAQAKREENFFSQNLDMSKKLKKKAEEGKIAGDFKIPEIKQRETDQEIRAKKKQIEEPEDRTTFLKSLFG